MFKGERGRERLSLAQWRPFKARREMECLLFPASDLNLPASSSSCNLDDQVEEEKEGGRRREGKLPPFVVIFLFNS